MGFVEMDQALLAQLLKEYEEDGGEDVLTEEASRLARFYEDRTCPQCAGKCRKSYDARVAYSSGEPVAHAILECLDCGCVFDPHSGLRIRQGNLGKIPVPDVLVKPKDD